MARFENFGEKDGLPSHKVHCVLKTSDGRLWIGTTNGLCVREPDGKFRRYGPEDGLSHPVVLSMAEDPRTGDLWIATMQGLTRFSGGKFTVFTQTNSGLPNNVVYGVAVIDDTVWAATPAGAGAYHIKTKTWSIYDQNNADMEEPWCYAIAPGDGVVYIGIWAGGIVEYDPRTGSFKAYRDPDGDFQFQLTPDSGPIADITSWVAYEDGILWQATYFGLSRYDTKEATWRTWVQDKTPLVSNFINTVFARGRVAWIATDRGVSRHRRHQLGQLHRRREWPRRGTDLPARSGTRDPHHGDGVGGRLCDGRLGRRPRGLVCHLQRPEPRHLRRADRFTDRRVESLSPFIPRRLP